MEKLNALESWTLYDSVMVSSIVDTLYKGAGWYTDYAALSTPAKIPFLNVRNSSIGVQYNNFDSRDKLPFVFELWSIGIDFNAPALSWQVPTEGYSAAAALFANELPKHCGFVLKVSQDEKLVQTAFLMPSGQGIEGWTDTMFETSGFATLAQDAGAGIAERSNRWKFMEPICMPREVNISGELIISEYGRDMLAKLMGPNDMKLQDDDSSPYAGAALIRVSLYGKREVQQRNALHFSV